MKYCFLFFLLLAFLRVFSQGVRIEYNPQTNAYPARPSVVDRVVYVGWINPNEIANSGFRNGYDVWEISLVRPQVTIDITEANISTIQTIVDNLDASKINRLYFRATGGLPTTFRNITVNCKAKHGVQFVGETDLQGNNLITINGSVFLNAWIANSGKFRSAVTNYDALVDRNTDTQDRFFAGYLNIPQLLFYNNTPLIPVGSIAEVNDNTKFYYDVAGGFVYINFNPSTNEIEWAQKEGLFHCGETSANYPNSTNGVAVCNLNITKFAGTSLSSPIGGRYYTHTTGSAYPVGSAVSGWYVANCNIDRNGGNGVFLHSRSTAFNNKVTNSGLISLHTTYAGTGLGYSTLISTSFIDNFVSNDNFRGMHSDYANGFKVVGQYKLLIRGNTVANQGFIFHNRRVRCNGIWLDFCDAGYFNESIIEGNTIYNTTDNAIHIEGTGHTVIRNNKIYDFSLSEIAPAPHGGVYISTSNNVLAENNTINARLINPSNSFEVKLITYKQSDRGSSLFSGQTLTTRRILFRSNEYFMTNSSGGTLIEYSNDSGSITTPAWQWAVNRRVRAYGNIFRNILSTTNFIQTGTGTDNLSIFQAKSPFFETNSSW